MPCQRGCPLKEALPSVACTCCFLWERVVLTAGGNGTKCVFDMVAGFGSACKSSPFVLDRTKKSW